MTDISERSEREQIVAALRDEAEASEKEANRLWGMGGPDEIGEAVVRKAVASAAREWAQNFEEGWHVTP